MLWTHRKHAIAEAFEQDDAARSNHGLRNITASNIRKYYCFNWPWALRRVEVECLIAANSVATICHAAVSSTVQIVFWWDSNLILKCLSMSGGFAKGRAPGGLYSDFHRSFRLQRAGTSQSALGTGDSLKSEFVLRTCGSPDWGSVLRIWSQS